MRRRKPRTFWELALTYMAKFFPDGCTPEQLAERMGVPTKRVERAMLTLRKKGFAEISGAKNPDCPPVDAARRPHDVRARLGE